MCDVFDRMRRETLETPDGAVVYWADGQETPGEPTLVLLHGLTADHRLFTAQAEHWLGRRRLLCWDAPGHGQSRPHADFTYARAAEALRRMLEREGVARPVFIGQSMGGYVAQALLREEPDGAAGFVGIDTCPFGEGYYSRSDLWWLRQMEWMCLCFPKGLLKRSVAQNSTRTDAARRSMMEMLAPYGRRELCRLLGQGYADLTPSGVAEPMELRCPAVLLVGERDRTGKVMAYNRAWQARTGLPLHVIPDAAHNSNADNPGAVNRIIDEFLRTVDAAQRDEYTK